MVDRIGVGLVGFGLGGRVFHAPFIKAEPAFSLNAVVSSDPAKVHALHPEADVVPSVEALLERGDVQLVVVSSPDVHHAAHAMAALQAGRDVVVDKPFATSLDDARAVTEAARASGRQLTVFQNRRWDADFLTLRRLMAEGRLGRIVQFESHFDRWRPDAQASWKEARPGGVWFDLGPHLVDQALVLFGRPQAVTARLDVLRQPGAAPDWAHVVLHYPGHHAIIHCTKLAADHGLRFAVHGTGGSWIKHGTDPQESAILGGALPGAAGLGDDPAPGRFTPPPGRGQPDMVANERGDYRLFWSELARSLKGEGANPVPAEQALQVMEVIEAGIESAGSGKTVLL